MATFAPAHCHRCGAAVTDVDPPTVYRCADCGDFVFHDPSPAARVVVLDGDALLLVEMAPHALVQGPEEYEGGTWTLPGGHVEIGEQPEEAAARELAEETGLAVAGDDLVLFDAVVRQVVEGAHGLNLLDAAEAAAASGDLRPASDAADARFWRPAEVAASDRDVREMYAEPDGYDDPAWLAERARAALAVRSR